MPGVLRTPVAAMGGRWFRLVPPDLSPPLIHVQYIYIYIYIYITRYNIYIILYIAISNKMRPERSQSLGMIQYKQSNTLDRRYKDEQSPYEVFSQSCSRHLSHQNTLQSSPSYFSALTHTHTQCSNKCRNGPLGFTFSALTRTTCSSWFGASWIECL